MNNEISLFPETRTEALALLYVQNQDLKGKTPTEIYELYKFAFDEIRMSGKSSNSQKAKY